MDEAFFLGIIFFHACCRARKLAALVRDVETRHSDELAQKHRTVESRVWRYCEKMGSSSDDATPEKCQRWRVTTSDNVPWNLGVRRRVFLALRFFALSLWVVRGKSWQSGKIWWDKWDAENTGQILGFALTDCCWVMSPQLTPIPLA